MEPRDPNPQERASASLLAGAVLLAGLTAIILIEHGVVLRGGHGGARSPPLPEGLELRLAGDRLRPAQLGQPRLQRRPGRPHAPGRAAPASRASPDGGECAVVFAAEQLDPEPLAAGQIQLEGQWVPLSSLLEPAALAELQSAAVGGANATITEQGDLIEQAP